MDEIEYHILPAGFMESVFGTNRRVTQSDDGTTIVQVSSYDNDRFEAYEVYEAEILKPVKPGARKSNAAFLKTMFGE